MFVRVRVQLQPTLVLCVLYGVELRPRVQDNMCFEILW